MRHEDLVKLGARIGMPVVEKIESENIEAVLQLVGNLDGNAEGFVSCWWNPNPPAEGTFFDEPYRVKTKGELYKLRHRMLAGITPSVLANAWRDGSIVDLLPILEEEYREDTEALVRQLDANTVALVEQIEAVYRDGAQHQDQKAFAAWVKTQPSNLAGLLFARKQLNYPKSASQYSRAALGRLIGVGQLHGLLEQSDRDELKLELARFERAVSQYLWDNSRTPEQRGRAQALAQTLPKPIRGMYASVQDNLFPHLIVEKVREFVSNSPMAEINCIDVDAVFANAPAPTAPEQIHNAWIFTQDMRLRPFLDRWRHCGQRATATMGARKLLAEAVRTSVVAESLDSLLELSPRRAATAKTRSILRFSARDSTNSPPRCSPSGSRCLGRTGRKPWPTPCRLWALRRITARRFCRKSGQASARKCAKLTWLPIRSWIPSPDSKTPDKSTR